MMLHSYNKNIIAIAALYIIPLTGLSIDIYVPSLPAITKYFSTTHVLAQNTITIYILGLGISQLIGGNVIDHFGRRKPLLISLIGYFILSLLIIFAYPIQMITYLRLAQGICMGFCAISARSVFIDLFSGDEYYKKASYITIAYAIGPIVAPAIGGYLQHYFGWQFCFYFLAIYSLLGILIVFCWIPETIKLKNRFNLKLVICRYQEMLFDRNFLLGFICLSMLNTSLMLFALVGPFLVQNKLHYSAIIFGQMGLLCGLSWFIGNVMNRVFIRKNRQIKINISLFFIAIDLLIMFILAQFWFNLYVIVIPVCLLLIAGSVMFSNYFIHTPTLFPNYSATAAAFMIGGYALFSSAICGLLAKIVTTNNQIPLILGYASLFLFCILANLIVSKLNKKYPRKSLLS